MQIFSNNLKRELVLIVEFLFFSFMIKFYLMMKFKYFYLIRSQRIRVFIKLMLKEHYCPFKVVCYIFVFHIESNDFSVSKFSSTLTNI